MWLVRLLFVLGAVQRVDDELGAVGVEKVAEDLREALFAHLLPLPAQPEQINGRFW